LDRWRRRFTLIETVLSGKSGGIKQRDEMSIDAKLVAWALTQIWGRLGSGERHSHGEIRESGCLEVKVFA
jgi:hypothetical protein